MDTSPEIPPLEPLLSAQQLADHLGLRVQAVYDLRHTGRGPAALRVGRELRFRASAVSAWLAELESHDAERQGGEG